MAKIIGGGLLTGSTAGRPIQITATTSGGAQTLHTTGGGVDFEEVTLQINNVGAATTLNLGAGGVADGDLFAKDLAVPANSSLLPFTIRLGPSIAIKAWAGTTALLNVSGSFNSVTTG